MNSSEINLYAIVQTGGKQFILSPNNWYDIDLLKEKKLHVDTIFKSIKTKVPYYFNVYEQDKDLHGNKVTEETIGGRRTFYVKSIQK